MIKKICIDVSRPPLRKISFGSGLRRNIDNVLVNNVAHEHTSCQTTHNSKRERGGWESQSNTTNVDDCLQAFTQNGDEGKEEHHVFFHISLEATPARLIGIGVMLQRLSKLHAPLFLELGNAQQGRTHDSDNQGGDDTKHTFPDVFRAGESIGAEAIEGTDHACAYRDADDQT